jgi:hypothetical protein
VARRKPDSVSLAPGAVVTHIAPGIFNMEGTMRLEDLLPAGTAAEWTCGHTGGAHCAECYRILARRAHQLAEENMELRATVSRLLVPGSPSTATLADARRLLHLGSGDAYDMGPMWP